MRTFINPNNPEQKVTTNLSFDQARMALKGMREDKAVNEKNRQFANSLAMKAKPSQAQEFWIYKLAEDYINPTKKETVKGGEGFKKVAELFATALANGLNRRAIRLQIPGESENEGKNPLEVKLTPASDKGRNSGYIYIKLNGDYMGKISPEGVFSPVMHCPNVLKDFVAEFGNNPVLIARQYGRMTSNCCFCGRNLDTAESNAVGYGPICAEKYGLPWGYETVKTTENKKVNLGTKRDDSLTPRPDYREHFEQQMKEEFC